MDSSSPPPVPMDMLMTSAPQATALSICLAIRSASHSTSSSRRVGVEGVEPQLGVGSDAEDALAVRALADDRGRHRGAVAGDLAAQVGHGLATAAVALADPGAAQVGDGRVEVAVDDRHLDALRRSRSRAPRRGSWRRTTTRRASTGVPRRRAPRPRRRWSPRPPPLRQPGGHRAVQRPPRRATPGPPPTGCGPAPEASPVEGGRRRGSGVGARRVGRRGLLRLVGGPRGRGLQPGVLS